VNSNFGKKVHIIIYIVALAVASSWVYAAEAISSKATAPVTEKAVAPTPPVTEKKVSDVRKPTGDVEKFWNNQDWKDLSAGEQKLWMVLGWNEMSYQQLVR